MKQLTDELQMLVIQQSKKRMEAAGQAENYEKLAADKRAESNQLEGSIQTLVALQKDLPKKLVEWNIGKLKEPLDRKAKTAVKTNSPS